MCLHITPYAFFMDVCCIPIWVAKGWERGSKGGEDGAEGNRTLSQGIPEILQYVCPENSDYTLLINQNTATSVRGTTNKIRMHG